VVKQQGAAREGYNNDSPLGLLHRARAHARTGASSSAATSSVSSAASAGASSAGASHCAAGVKKRDHTIAFGASGNGLTAAGSAAQGMTACWPTYGLREGETPALGLRSG